jgi:hypothetical protein
VLENNLRIAMKKLLEARAKNPLLKISSPNELRTIGVSLHDDINVPTIVAETDYCEIIMHHKGLTAENSKAVTGLNVGEGKVTVKKGQIAIYLPEIVVAE